MKEIDHSLLFIEVDKKEINPQPSTQCFVFFKDQLLLKKESETRYSVPQDTELPISPSPGNKIHEVTTADGQTVRTFAVEQLMIDTEEWIMVNLRASYDYLSWQDYQAAGKAYQILYWDQHSRFCSVCGMPMQHKTSIMKKCPCCGYEMYPPIATAVIVLIRRGEEILLVHARNFRGGFYGLVAGFLEAGETLEQCVHREVLEETGLRVKNIAYFDNQPWPYPSGLMVGFTADYDSGEIKLQKDELSAGAFFTKENLPEIPRKLSIARKMIDWWINN